MGYPCVTFFLLQSNANHSQDTHTAPLQVRAISKRFAFMSELKQAIWACFLLNIYLAVFAISPFHA